MVSEELRNFQSNELIEIPDTIGKRHEPVIKGKGVPVWIIVSYSTKRQMTPEQISRMWNGYITVEEVEAAIEYSQSNPESIEDRLGNMENGLGG